MLYCIFQSLSAHAFRGKYRAAWQKSSSLRDHLREASGSWIFLVHMFHCELISVILRPPQRKEQGHSKIQRRQLWNHKKRVLSNQSYIYSFDQWFLKNIIWHNFSQLKKQYSYVHFCQWTLLYIDFLSEAFRHTLTAHMPTDEYIMAVARTDCMTFQSQDNHKCAPLLRHP